ncbi:LytR C-terminal domain-containing protein [Streptomyces sp. TP-A0356]|uniref:LytR C-terminal domain-containing protein n=1 Tax=Streptomyces sp. TP-A0356 TaxID=1359208 RepID=UPI000A75803F|nr:LytR C-terminal domain-containing protein [Streptomyces sp. TP-A0356]
MSMLTPPGMGGQYRITGDKYPRMRRPRRRGRLLFAVVASMAAIGLIGWGTLQLIDVFTGGGGRASAFGAKACAKRASGSPTTAARALPEPGRITVNVLNATARSGLAKVTADELKKRGFHIGTVGNATKEYDKKVKGVGILLGPKTAADTTLPVLGTQLAEAERHTDARTGTTVDLILGDGFKSLTTKTDADKALSALTGPASSPSPGTKGC